MKYDKYIIRNATILKPGWMLLPDIEYNGESLMKTVFRESDIDAPKVMEMEAVYMCVTSKQGNSMYSIGVSITHKQAKVIDRAIDRFKQKLELLCGMDWEEANKEIEYTATLLREAM